MSALSNVSNPALHHRIRKFEPGDAPRVARIAAQSPGAAQWSEPSIALLAGPTYNSWISLDAETATLSGFLIARELAPEAEILNLAVAPEYRRTGTASALLAAALTELAHARIERVYLEVRASNHPAISFYNKHLFRQSGKRPAYYRDPTEDAILMQRIL